MLGSHTKPIPAFQALCTVRNRRRSRWRQDGVKSAVCASLAICVEQNKDFEASFHPPCMGGISFPLLPQEIIHGLTKLLRVGHSFFPLLLPTPIFKVSNTASYVPSY